MIAEKRARSLITKAQESVQPTLLDEAYALAQTLFAPSAASEPSVLQTILSPELPVLIAEVALDLSAPTRTEDEAIQHRERMQDLADTCLKKYNSPTPNQFLARAYLAQANLAGRNASGRKGDGLVDQVLKSLDFVMKGLEIAQSSPEYSFLVYNASVMYWRVSRPLQRRGYFKHLLPSMPEMAKAVRGLGEEDRAWKVQFVYALASAYAQDEQAEQALKTLTEGWADAEAEGGEAELRYVRLAVHADRGKGGASGEKLAGHPQAKAHAAMQKVLSGVTPEDKVEAELEELLGSLSPAEGEPPEVQDSRLVAELSRAALIRGLPELARRAAEVVEKSKEAGIAATVLAECSRLEMKLLELGQEAEQYSRRMVSARTEAIGRLEKCLLSALRANDPEVVHECAALAWTLSLPLLQPTLRKHTKRLLQAAAKGLHDIKSPLHELRVQMHLELARTDVAEDLYASAAVQVNRAMALDYYVEEEEEKPREYKRPFDSHLNLMYKKLSMKMSLYSAPDREEDKAMLIIEQAREAKDPSLKSTLLESAIGMLATLPPATARPAEEAAAPELNEAVDPVFTEKGVQKERAALWADIALIAWQSLLPKITLQAGEEVVNAEWDPEVDKAVMIQQAQVQFACSEARFKQLREQGVQPGQPLPSAAGTLNAQAAAKQDEWVLEERSKILRGFIEGMKLGRRVKEDWLVLNGATYIWNYHLALIKRGELETLYEALEQAAALVLQLETKDARVACSVADALAAALLARHQQDLDCKYPPDDIEDAPPLGDGSCIGHGLAVCQAAVEMGTAMQAKRPLAQMAQLQFVKGGSGSVSMPEEAESKLVMLVELMRLEQLAGNAEGVQGLVEQATGILPDCPPNPEMFARLGTAALWSGAYGACMTATKKAVATVDKIPTVLPEIWRWFALAEVTQGQALIRQIDPDKHDMSAQDQLKQVAMGHFVQGAQHASAVPLPGLALVAAQHFWNASVSFMKSPATRGVLLKPLSRMIKELANTKVTEDMEEGVKTFRTKMYVLLLEALADGGAWAEGLDYTGKALKVLPPSCHKDLWDLRIRFMGKVGKDTSAEMLRVKESGEELVARAWVTLAESTTDRAKQLQAYNKAVEVLEARPVAQAEYLVLYGEFLYTAGFPVEDARDQLEGAAEALLELEAAVEEEDSKSEVASSVGDSKSVSSAASSYYQPPKSTATSSRAASSRAGSTVASSRAGSMISEVASGEPKSINVSHVQELGRIYIMLARMAPDRKAALNALLVAHHYLVRTFSMSVAFLNAKAQEARGDEERAEDDQDIEVPKDMQGWIGYRLPDEVAAKMMEDKSKERMVLNKRTVKRAGQLVFYLDEILLMLREQGLQLHCLPILELQRFVVKHVVGSQEQASRALLTAAEIYDELGLGGPEGEANACRELAGSLRLTREEERRLGEAVRQRELVKERALADATDGNGMGGSRPATAGSGKDKNVKVLRPVEAHAVWIQQAALKIQEGDLLLGKELLQRALTHCRAFDDGEGEGKALHLLASLAFLEGNIAQALQLEMEAQTQPNGLNFWLDSCSAQAQYLAAQAASQSGAGTVDDALKVLERGFDTLGMVLAQQPNLQLQIQTLRGRLVLRAASICLAESKRQDSLGQVLWRKAHRAAQGQVDEMVKVLSQLGGGPLLVDLLLVQCRLAIDPPVPKGDNAGRQNQLTAGLEILEKAEEEGKACAAVARPAEALRPGLRLQADVRLAQVKLEQARATQMLAVEKLQHPWAVQPRPEIPDFPTVEGKDVAPVKEYLDPLNYLEDGGQDAVMSKEELAVVHATAAVQLAVDPRQRAEAKAVMGGCLRLLAESKGVLNKVWDPPPKPKVKPGSAEGEEGEAGEEGGEAEGEAEEKAEAEAGAGEEEEEEEVKDEEGLVASAKQALEEALQECLALQCLDAAAQAAVDLALCMGQRGGQLGVETAGAIATAQACQASAGLAEAMRIALPLSNPERCAMRKVDFLENGGRNAWGPQVRLTSKSAQLTNAKNLLKDASVAMKRLQVQHDLQELLAPVAEDCMVCALALHPGRHGTELLCAVTHGGAAGAGVLGEEEGAKWKGQVLKFGVDEALLAAARADSATLRERMRRKHLDIGYTEEAGRGTKDLLLGASSKTENMMAPWSEAMREVRKRMAGEEGEQGGSVVLLLDRRLAMLPWEASQCLRGSVASRDFFLGLHAARLQAAASVDQGGLRFIVDPRKEDTGQTNGVVERGEDAQTMTDAAAAAFEAPWQGVSGQDRIPSHREVQGTLSEASLLLYLSVGPLFTVAPAGLVASLKLPSLQLAVLLDRCENEAAYRRQSKIDTTEMPDQLALRDPWATAGLLSVRGANAVVVNQWTTDPTNNHEIAVGLVSEGVLGGGKKGGGSGVAEALKNVGVEKLFSCQDTERALHEAQEALVKLADLRAETPGGSLKPKPAAEGAEGAEDGEGGEEGAAEEGGEQGGGAEEEEGPSEEEVEAARAEVERLKEEKEEKEADMGGVESRLNPVLYGLGGISG